MWMHEVVSGDSGDWKTPSIQSKLKNKSYSSGMNNDNKVP